MDIILAEKRIKELSDSLKYHNRKYYIEDSPEISDFEYDAPNHYVKHPRFLYYAPISASNWQWIIKFATSFAKSMLNICPNIRKHILM